MNSIKRGIRSISELILHDKIDKRRRAYRHSSLIPSKLRLVLLISLFFWFNVLVVSPSSHSYQIAAAKQIMNSTDHNLKSQTSLQLMTFDLPSKQTINENEDPVVNDLIIKLVAEADSYLSQKSPSVMDKLECPQVVTNTIFYPRPHFIGPIIQNQMGCHISIGTVSLTLKYPLLMMGYLCIG